MTTGGLITVLGGIHAGASMLLSDGESVVIGNGQDAQFVLVDDNVAARHATIVLDGSVLRLTAHHEGVRVFGYPLAMGRTTVLKQGASFSVGGAQIQFSGRDVPAPDVVRGAELSWLLAHSPLAWLAKRWSLTPRGSKLALMIVLMSAVAGALWQIAGPRELPGTPVAELHGALRFVTVRDDPDTHARVYEGYVSNAADLAALAALIRRDAHPSVMRVMVVDQVKEQLADFLAKYYRGAQISAGAPGTFTVVPPPEAGHLLPESWDYRRIARLARESIQGLLEVKFGGSAAIGGTVRAPLRAIGMNLSRSAKGSWLVDARGTRYFQGAQLPLGRIVRIDGCTVTIMRDDDGTLYEFFAEGANGDEQCN
ncbi:MAG TPA: FHA domain-containing protein [Paraburkholderia sp.]|jgi:type III secretion system YscD/HrpQ family protein|nr:FHA domain-containing protein [Paraburkholderia sp.]